MRLPINVELIITRDESQRNDGDHEVIINNLLQSTEKAFSISEKHIDHTQNQFEEFPIGARGSC